MSTPSRPLVTIDDPVTIIEPHRVLLESVDQVHRDGFYVRSQTDHTDARLGGPPAYRHDAEGTTWARGHHLPDSEVVVALRAAASLVVHNELTPQEMQRELLKRGLKLPVLPLPQLPAAPPFDLQKAIEEAKKAMEEAKTTRSWWHGVFGSGS